MLIFLCLMAEAFFGYLLPWGQMSYWGAQVIVNLFDAIPVIGPDLAIWIRGDFVVSDATLNRFFAYHVIAVPLALLALVVAHLLALHEVGSSNPDGVEIKNVKDPKTGRPLDGIPFHPYYTVKDTFGVVVFLIVFSMVVFFAPDAGGYFLEHNNFIPADPLKTPAHIAPVWYFTPYYSILRATTDEFVLWVLVPGVVAFALLLIGSMKKSAARIAVGVIAIALLAGLLSLDAKVWGVVLMGTSVMIFFFLPWLDLGPTEQQIKETLRFTTDKIGDLTNVAMTRKDAKEWRGTAPPDLSVVARARGPDWLYTYMRSFYRDPESATGWNNMVFERVAMPHVLWTLSGQQAQEE